MKRCKLCLQTDTRPGIIFQGDVCQGCLNFSNRKSIDWDTRILELKELTKGKRVGVAISGGKDSYFLTHLATQVLNARPTLIRIGDPFGYWPNAKENIQNLQDRFELPMVQWRLDFETYRRLCRAGFEELGNFPWLDVLIYMGSLRLAGSLGLDVLLFGEYAGFEYGCTTEEESEVSFSGFSDTLRWMKRILDWGDFAFLANANDYQCGVQSLYTSYFVPWSASRNFEIAKTSYGFKDCGVDRAGYAVRYSQMDALGWGISNRLKFQKFGFSRVTDEVSGLLREGKMSLQKAKELIEREDSRLSVAVLEDFLRVSGYSYEEYNAIAEKWWNKDLFVKEGNTWNLKSGNGINAQVARVQNG